MDTAALFKGIVSNNTDPEGLYRIKAICPQVFGDSTTETDWAWPVVMPGWTSQTSAMVKEHRTCVVYSGGGLGTSYLDTTHVLDFPTPNPGHGVWLAFEGGDIEYPMWLGVWK